MTENIQLQFCEHILCPKEQRVFNTDSGFLLIYVKEGAGTFLVNGKSRDFVSGTMVLMTCLDFLKNEPSAETVKLVELKLGNHVFSGRVPEFLGIRNLPIFTDFNDRQKPESLLELFESCIRAPQKNDDIFLRNLSKELIIYMVKNSSPDGISSIYDTKTELALFYIYSHFKEALSIETVAGHIHYSMNYFHHSFRKHTGTTFRTFLHSLRLDYAMNLIRYTNLSITDICYECGCNSVQYFSATFRKQFGYSPTKFINKYINKENQQ